MNAVMRIQVRVINGASPEIKAIQAQLTSLARTAAAANKAIMASTAQNAAGTTRLAAATGAATMAQGKFAQAMRMTPLEKYGKNLQWTGRQIEYNFTLPLLLAGGAAVKWALDTERAMVRVDKVYGSTADQAKLLMAANSGMTEDMARTEATRIFESELKALEGAFTALSNAYGVNRAEVLKVAGDWAAAGASGVALARQVRMTMDTMILGELGAVEATEALIAIQAQYGLQAGDMGAMLDKVNSKVRVQASEMNTLSGVIATLNTIENETGAQFGDLTIAFSRAAGMARTAGIDVRTLGAHIAALRPAAGTAAQVGNGLKSMYASITSPTKAAAEIMGLMGIELTDVAWKSADAGERIEILSDKFVKLDKAQQNVVATTIATKWQVSRAGVLFRDVASGVGYYNKALEATADANEVLLTYQRELTKVLTSNPRKVEILKTTMQNLMADAVIPLIPAIVGLMDRLKDLMVGFSNLSPAMQQIIIGGLVLLAVFGTMTRLMGAVILLFTRFGAMLAWVAHAFVYVFKGGSAAAAATAAQAAAASAGAPANAAAAASTGRFAAALTWLGGVATATAGIVAAAMKAMVAAVLWGPKAIISVMSLLGAVITTAPVWAAAGLSKVLGVYFAFGTAMSGWYASMLGMQVRFQTAMWGLQTKFAAGMSAIWWAMGASVLKAQLFWHMTALPMMRDFAFSMIASNGTFLAHLSNMYWAFVGAMQRAWAAMLMGMTKLWYMHARPMLASWASFWATKVAIAWTGVKGVIASMLTMMRTGLLLLLKGSTWVRAWTIMWGFMVTVTRTALTNILRLVALGAAALMTPWTLVFVAMIGVVYMFRDKIAKAVNHVIKSWYAMPTGIMGAMRAVVAVIAKGVKAAYEWLSYLNPFQRHSPSLVDNVNAGVDLIAKKYASLSNIGRHFRQAVNDLNAFGKATENMMARADNAEYNENRALVVAEMGPGAGASMDRLRAGAQRLKGDLALVGAEIVKQSRVVDDWARQLDDANDRLKAAGDHLDVLRARATALSDQMEAAQADLERFSNAPLVGMGKMNDAIWANQHAQNVLNLELLKMKQAGKNVDDVKDRMASLAGEIEMLSGQRTDLRLAGAGSDVLGTIDAQIAQIQAAYKEAGSGLDEVSKAQKDLERLELEGQILDLQKEVDFGPMLRDIEKMVDTSKELTFEEIVAGIGKAKELIATLQPQLDAANGAVKQQEAVVDAFTRQRDAMQDRYDAEQEALKALQDTYGAIEDQIRDMESAMRDFVSVARDAESAREQAKAAKDAGADAMSPQAQNFLDAAGGDYPDPGGTGLIGRDLGAGLDQTQAIEDFQKQLEEDLKQGFGSFDIFAPIKDAFRGFVAWIDSWTGGFASNLIQGLKDNTSRAFAGAGIGAALGAMVGGPLGAVLGTIIGGVIGAFVSEDMLKDLGGAIVDVFGWIGDALSPVADLIGKVWDGMKAGASILADLFGPQIEEIWTQFTQFFGDLKESISNNFTEPMRDLGPQFKTIWGAIVGAFSWAKDNIGSILKVIGALFAPLVAATTLAWSIIFSVLKHVAVPIFDFIAEMLGAFLQMVSGVIKFLVSLFTGDLTGMKDAALMILGAMWDAVFALFRGIGGVLWGIVKGIFEGVVDWFKWVYDVLVGHSIIPDLINAIIWWFQFLTAPVLAALGLLWDGIKFLWENVALPIFNLIWEGIKVWASIFGWVWENIVKPAVGAWWEGVKFLWETVGKVLFTVIETYIKVWAAVFGWVWDNLIKPAITKLWEGIRWAWENAIKPVLGFLWDALKWVGDKFTWLWENAVKPAWEAIKTAIKWAWENYYKPIFTALWDILKWVGEKFAWLWNSAIKPAWDAIKQAIQWAWDNVLSPVLNAFKDIAGAVGSAFGSLRDKMGGIWSDIKGAIKGPVDTIRGWIDNLFGKVGDVISKISNIKFPSMPSWLGGGSSSGGFGTGGGGGSWGGGFDFDFGSLMDFGNFSMFAKGGRIGQGFRTTGPQAVVGEGNQAYPEYVIPTDPRYKNNALALTQDLLRDLRIPGFATGGALGAAAVRARAAGVAGRASREAPVAYATSTHNEYHFYGDLSFPNIEDGEDAEDFLRNLETLAGT